MTHGIGNGLARFKTEMPVLERLATLAQHFFHTFPQPGA